MDNKKLIIMELKLVSFELALLLKGAGFDINTISLAYINYYSDSFEGVRKYILKTYSKGVYNGENPIYLAPTLALAQQWLREVHNINVDITSVNLIPKTFMFNIRYLIRGTGHSRCSLSLNYVDFKTYDKALEAGIKEAIKLIKK